MSMVITIPAGQKLEIKFENADGGFEVHFDTPEHAKAIVVKEAAGLSATNEGEANEILYREKYEEEPFELNRLYEADTDSAVE
jgi:hypothetical protein